MLHPKRFRSAAVILILSFAAGWAAPAPSRAEPPSPASGVSVSEIETGIEAGRAARGILTPITLGYKELSGPANLASLSRSPRRESLVFLAKDSAIDFEARHAAVMSRILTEPGYLAEFERIRKTARRSIVRAENRRAGIAMFSSLVLGAALGYATRHASLEEDVADTASNVALTLISVPTLYFAASVISPSASARSRVRLASNVWRVLRHTESVLGLRFVPEIGADSGRGDLWDDVLHGTDPNRAGRDAAALEDSVRYLNQFMNLMLPTTDAVDAAALEKAILLASDSPGVQPAYLQARAEMIASRDAKKASIAQAETDGLSTQETIASADRLSGIAVQKLLMSGIARNRGIPDAWQDPEGLLKLSSRLTSQVLPNGRLSSRSPVLETYDVLLVSSVAR